MKEEERMWGWYEVDSGSPCREDVRSMREVVEFTEVHQVQSHSSRITLELDVMTSELVSGSQFTKFTQLGYFTT